jgi:hypothetical protein
MKRDVAVVILLFAAGAGAGLIARKAEPRQAVVVLVRDALELEAISNEYPSGDARFDGIEAAETGWELLDDLANADAKEMPKLLEERIHEWEGWKLILARWIELDPKGALARLLEKKDGYMLQDLMKAWVLHDREAAWRELDNIPEGKAQDFAWHGVLEALAECDPEEVLNHTDRFGSRYLQAIITAFKNIAKEDPERAAELLDNVPARHQKNARMGIASAQAPEDQSVARNALDRFVSGGVADDPVAALDRFASLSPGEYQAERMLDEIVSAFAKTDPVESVRLMKEKLPKQTAQEAERKLIRAVLARDVETGFELLTQIDDPSAAASLALSIFSNWDRAKFAEAVSAAQKILPEGKLRDAALEGITSRWSRFYTKESLEAIARIEDKATRDKLEQQAFDSLLGGFGNRVEEAWKVATQVEDASRRREMLKSPFAAIVSSDPTEAAKRLDVFAGEMKSAAAFHVASNWASHDPLGAVEWALQNSEGDISAEAVAGAVNRWARTDPHGVPVRLESLEPGAARDAAITELVMAIAVDDSERALAWAAEVGGEEQRGRMIEFALRSWLADEEQSPLVSEAMRALAELELPPEARNAAAQRYTETIGQPFDPLEFVKVR